MTIQNRLTFYLCLTNTGEWFNADPEAIIQQALQTGAGPNVSEAYTFNGLPGPLYNCSAKGAYIFVCTHYPITSHKIFVTNLSYVMNCTQTHTS